MAGMSSPDVSNRRPRAATLPSDVLRKLQEGRLLHQLERENETHGGSDSNLPINSDISTNKGHGFVLNSHQKAHLRLATFERSRTRCDSLSSSGSSTSGSNSDLSRAFKKIVVNGHDAPKENGRLGTNYLKVPRPCWQEVGGREDSGSLQDFSDTESNAERYIDYCMKIHSDESLAVQREPLPKGSEIFEKVRVELDTESDEGWKEEDGDKRRRTKSLKTNKTRVKQILTRTRSDPNAKNNKHVHFGSSVRTVVH